MSNIKRLTIIGLLISTQIILTRFLSIQTTVVRISFGFIPICIAAILYGPVYTGIMAAIADILGMIIFPKGIYFPGFTISAFVNGLLYGIFLYRKNITNIMIIWTVIIIGSINLALNSMWLMILTQKAYLIILLPKIFQFIVMVAITYFTIKYLVFKITVLNKNLFIKNYLEK